MTAKDKGNYPGKHQSGEQPDEAIKYEIEKETEPGELPCAVAFTICLLYTSPSPRDRQKSRMPSSA